MNDSVQEDMLFFTNHIVKAFLPAEGQQYHRPEVDNQGEPGHVVANDAQWHIVQNAKCIAEKLTDLDAILRQENNGKRESGY